MDKVMWKPPSLQLNVQRKVPSISKQFYPSHTKRSTSPLVSSFQQEFTGKQAQKYSKACYANKTTFSTRSA
eukprot:14907439-Ditylum_brightwellii.AAC.1